MMSWIQPSTYQSPIYTFSRSPDQDAKEPVLHPAIVVGAGPVGLVAALDLAHYGVPVVLLEKGKSVSNGSRAICFAKRSLEIADRLGVGERLLDKGVTWNVGKVFFRDELVYEFNLLPEAGFKHPAFINLQQYYFEEYLIEAALKHPLIDLRWENEVVGVESLDEHAVLTIDTPDGPYELVAYYLLACDGIRSAVRTLMNLPYEGEAFDEHFLIADITMEADFPTERWFWFDPPFNPGRSALLHKQPDGVWRIDLQLGREVDRDRELDPEHIRSRLRRMLGPNVAFQLEWTSIYQFKCLRMPQFREGSVFFLGDSAHQVSPFGARGANGGIQDAENIAWKLALVLNQEAPAILLESYHQERSPAADENICHSAQTTDFISPKSSASLYLRNRVLASAKEEPAFRPLINSGRLSTPFHYLDSLLISPDLDNFEGPLFPGMPAPDVPLTTEGQTVWLLDIIGGCFNLLLYQGHQMDKGLKASAIWQEVLLINLSVEPNQPGYLDGQALFARRYDARPGTWYLIRPDQHIAARGRHLTISGLREALDRATGKHLSTNSAERLPRLAMSEGDKKYNLLVTALSRVLG